MKFQTKYSRKEFSKTYEKGGGKRMVETAGYIPAKQRIENMIMAGQRLALARKELYDFDGEVDENFEDPTRRPGYDLADAFQDNEKVKIRLKNAKKEQIEKKEVSPPPAEPTVEK